MRMMAFLMGLKAAEKQNGAEIGPDNFSANLTAITRRSGRCGQDFAALGRRRPSREGLRETPDRVVRAFDEFFAGYAIDPAQLLARTFEEVDGYDEMVLLRDIRFESYCEHHMVPIVGKVHIAYLPRHRVVGISKLARVIEVFAKRLQIQEKMTAQIANTIEEVLQPDGVAVVIEGEHQCMTTRGVHKPGVGMITSRMLGAFRTNPSTRQEFLSLIGNPGIHG